MSNTTTDFPGETPSEGRRRGRRPRVLYLHPTAERTGTDRLLLDLLAEEAGRRSEVAVAVPRPGPLVTLLRSRGVRVEIGPLGVATASSRHPWGLARLVGELPAALRFVRGVVRDLQPDVIHTNTAAVLGGAWAARRANVPHLWHVHEILVHRRWATRLLARLFARWADRVVFNSHATADSYLECRPTLARHSRVVWNGTSYGAEIPEEEARDRERSVLGVALHEPLVLLMGPIDSWRGQGLLLEAARRLRDRHPAVRYVLAGEPAPGGEHFELALRQRRAALGLGEVVRIVPPGSDPARFLLAADVVVVPSLHPEPGGLAAIEAMAFGRPVVAADHGGLSEIVREGETGVLFEPGNADALADALDHVLGTPGRARRLGRAGHERQRRYFSAADFRRRFRGIHANLVGYRGAPTLGARTRIIHVTVGAPNPTFDNDVHRLVHHLATAQQRRGLQVEAWALGVDPEVPAPTREYAARRFARSPLPLVLTWAVVEALDALRGPCLFHVHGGPCSTLRLLARALHRRGLPFVYAPHRVPGRWERRLGRHARAWHVATAEEARAVTDRRPGARVVVVPQGQGPLDPEPDVRRVDAPGPIFGFCGPLRQRAEGLDVLVDGFALYAAAGGEGTLHFGGDGPDRGRLARRAVRAGIGKRALFLGTQFASDARSLVRTFDVFCHPSPGGASAARTLEAAALGCPVLVGAESGLAAAVDAAASGFVVPDLDAAGVSRTLQACEVLRLTGELGVMGRRALEMVATEFPWDRVAGIVATELYHLAGWPGRLEDPNRAERGRAPRQAG